MKAKKLFCSTHYEENSGRLSRSGVDWEPAPAHTAANQNHIAVLCYAYWWEDKTDVILETSVLHWQKGVSVKTRELLPRAPIYQAVIKAVEAYQRLHEEYGHLWEE